MDKLTEFLISDRQPTRVSPESLEFMGKQAAALYLDSGVPLNQAVVKVASEHDSLSSEHLKRVCEFANTTVYLHHHDKSKTAGEKSSYPQFDLADPARVIASLTSNATVKVASTVAIDYQRAPVHKSKVAAAEAEDLLADMFEAKDREPDIEFTSNTAVEEVYAAKSQLQGLKEHLEHSAERLDLLRKEAAADYYFAVKSHLLNGGSFSNVVAAARTPGADYEKVAAALKPFVYQLMKDKVASFEQLKAQTEGFEKVAHRVVNEAHPLCSTFKALLDLDAEIEKVATGLVDVDDQLKAVKAFIKDHLYAVPAR